jgi:hypothetical protein
MSFRLKVIPIFICPYIQPFQAGPFRQSFPKGDLTATLQVEH